jgi:hypothetical protein
MYQSEIKESFIKDYMRSRIVAKTSLYSLFRKTEKYEERFKKDCCQFTPNEVFEMYKEFEAKSVFVLLNYNVILKAYCAWQKYYNGLDTEIVYDGITRQMLNPLIPKREILSRDDVTDIEDQLYNWTDKAIIEALFEGLSGNSMRDLVSVDEDMVDHKNKRLIFPDGRVFDLTDRLYALLMESFRETEYLCYGHTMRIKKLIGTGRLYKERDNAHATDSDDKYFRWVYRKVQNARKHVGINDLTMKNLATAGLIYYLRKGMDETGLGLKPFLLTEMGEKLLDKYGYNSAFRVDNVVNRYGHII